MYEEALKRINRIRFEQTFLVDAVQGAEYTYAAFFSHALRTAEYINGNHTGNTVVAVMENSYPLALLYFAVMFTNKRIAVIDPQKGADEILELMEGIECSCAFLDEGVRKKLSKELCVLKVPEKHEIGKADEVREKVIRIIGERTTGAPYLVTFTSGTSGNTKGVEHSLESLFLTASALDQKVKKEGGVFFHVMPMTYMAGILNSLFYPFLAGCKIVIGSRFSIVSARNFWNTVKQYGADLFWVSPSMLLMIDRMDRGTAGEEYCRTNDTTFLVGTAALTNDLRGRFNNRYGVTVYASYGLSETLFISVETKESLKNNPQSCVGEFLDGVEYRMDDAGEIRVRVPWMFLRYTNENTDAYFADGFYKTGDMGEVRSDCLFITGRAKELIVKGGMNLSPAKIEEIVSLHAVVEECVVLGVNDRDGEEKVCCMYTTNTGIPAGEDAEREIRKVVLDKLGKNYTIDYLCHIDQLYRNMNGKIDRKKLTEVWERQNHG